jgi:hypothetical protein
VAEEVIVEHASAAGGTHFSATLQANQSQALLGENHSREALIVSADTADAFLWYGAGPAVVGKGIRLKAGAAPYVDESWKGAVQIISAGAAVIAGLELDYSLGDDEGEEPTGAQTFTPSGPSDAPIPAPTAPPGGGTFGQ